MSLVLMLIPHSTALRDHSTLHLAHDQTGVQRLAQLYTSPPFLPNLPLHAPPHARSPFAGLTLAHLPPPPPPPPPRGGCTAARTTSALPCPPLPPPPTFQVAIRKFNPGPPPSNTTTTLYSTQTPTTGWVYSGSHNFSPAAWGRPVRKRHLSCDPAAAEDLGVAAVLGDCLHVLNFELGVVLVESHGGQRGQQQGQGQRGWGGRGLGGRELGGAGQGKFEGKGLQGGRGRWGGQWGRQQGQGGRWKNGSASGIGGAGGIQGTLAAGTGLQHEDQQGAGGSGSVCERGMGIDRVHLPFRLPAPRYSRSDAPASGRALKEAVIAAALAAAAAADSESGGEGESVLAHAAAVAAAAGCASSGGSSCAIGSPVCAGGSGGVAAAPAADGAAANAAFRKVALASLPGSPLSNALSSASLKSLLGALSPLAAGATAGAAGAGAAAALGVAERMLQVVEEVDEEEGGAVGVDADALARDALRNETHLLLHDYV
ncbi:unnamed protein product [Closterium sp. NIES-53]